MNLFISESNVGSSRWIFQWAEGINHCEMGSPQVAEKKIALEIVEPII